MEFNNKNKRRSKKSIDQSHSSVEYSLPLMMYNKKPPKEEIALEEFERFAIDRLKRMSIFFVYQKSPFSKIDYPLRLINKLISTVRDIVTDVQNY